MNDSWNKCGQRSAGQSYWLVLTPGLKGQESFRVECGGEYNYKTDYGK